MALPPSIAARARALRAETPAPPAEVDDEDVVQLAVRMPLALRDGIRQAAGRERCSIQEWVNRALRAAVVEASDPQLELAGRLLDELRVELGLVVESGAYERYVQALDDPDVTDD